MSETTSNQYVMNTGVPYDNERRLRQMAASLLEAQQAMAAQQADGPATTPGVGVDRDPGRTPGHPYLA